MGRAGGGEGGRICDPDSRTPAEQLELLDDRRELAESIVLEEDLERYRLELTEGELRGPLVVKGPEGEGWRAVAEGSAVGPSRTASRAPTTSER